MLTIMRGSAMLGGWRRVLASEKASRRFEQEVYAAYWQLDHFTLANVDTAFVTGGLSGISLTPRYMSYLYRHIIKRTSS